MTWDEGNSEANSQVYVQANRSPARAAAAPSLLEFDDGQAAPGQPAASAAPASMQGEPSATEAGTCMHQCIQNLSQADLS